MKAVYYTFILLCVCLCLWRTAWSCLCLWRTAWSGTAYIMVVV